MTDQQTHGETSSDTGYETIQVRTEGRVGIIQLDRPKALNALNSQLCREVVQAAAAFDADENIGAIILTGSD